VLKRLLLSSRNSPEINEYFYGQQNNVDYAALQIEGGAQGSDIGCFIILVLVKITPIVPKLQSDKHQKVEVEWIFQRIWEECWHFLTSKQNVPAKVKIVAFLRAPSTNPPITNPPITNHPSTNHPSTNHQSTNHPSTNHQSTNHQSTNHQSTNHQSPITNHQSTNHQSPIHQSPITNHQSKITNQKNRD